MIKTFSLTFESFLCSIGRYIVLYWPLDLVSTIGGGVVGLFLVYLVDWIRKARIKYIGFKKAHATFGTLYKLHFIVKGRRSPGICRMQIRWDGKSVFAKWDENPNPLDRDVLGAFRAELVPSTFDQTLFNGEEYFVPVVIENGATRKVFSGWWFGHQLGYGPDPTLREGFSIDIVLIGTDIKWSRQFSEKEICG